MSLTISRYSAFLRRASVFALCLTSTACAHTVIPRPESPTENLTALAPLLDTTGFRGTILLYDLRAHRFRAVHPEGADTRRIPASTFKIVNALVALETRVVQDAHTIIPWDSVVRPRRELNRDLDLAAAFRLSAVPHFQRLARAEGLGRLQQFVDLLGYGNRDLSGGVDQFWLTGGLRISPREQIDFLVRLYREELPFSRRTIAVVKDIMEVERTNTSVVRAKTGWAVMPDGHEVGWWVGWVERGPETVFFASVIEGNQPGPQFGPARTDVPRAVLRRLGVLDPAA
jgi:beta-lactamase class D